MPIVYFLLTILNQKKIIKSQNSKTIGEIVKSQLKKEYVIENIVMCQMIVNGSVLNLANLSETRTLCQFVFDRPYVFSDLFYYCPNWLTLIFGRKISCKTSIKKTMA